MTAQNAQPLPENLGSDIFKRLRLLKQNKESGKVSISDMEQILDSLIASFSANISDTSQLIKAELASIISHLNSTRQELGNMSGGGINAEKITDASDTLRAIVSHTEEASNTIMDAAEEISNAAAGISAPQSEQIMNSVTKIFEACNFHDLTGQRIKRVVETLEYIEKKVSRIAELCGEEEEQFKTFEQSLMNGPQLSKDAPSQDDVDNLFNNS